MSQCGVLSFRTPGWNIKKWARDLSNNCVICDNISVVGQGLAEFVWRFCCCNLR